MDHHYNISAEVSNFTAEYMYEIMYWFKNEQHGFEISTSIAGKLSDFFKTLDVLFYPNTVSETIQTYEYKGNRYSVRMERVTDQSEGRVTILSCDVCFNSESLTISCEKTSDGYKYNIIGPTLNSQIARLVCARVLDAITKGETV